MSEERIEGEVKFFDADRGYGFLRCDALVGDVHFTTAALKRAGRDRTESGARFSFTVQHYPGDKRAAFSMHLVQDAPPPPEPVSRRRRRVPRR